MSVLSERIAGLQTERRVYFEQWLSKFAALESHLPISPRKDRSPAPLSFAQERLWFLDQLQPGMSIYNIPAALPLHFAVNEVVLEQCLKELARRHETLRTTFAME